MRDTGMATISILVADDHTLLAESLELFLQSDGGFTVQRAETLERALAKIAEHGAFDVVLLDLDMPGMAGLQGLEKALAANAPGRVVLFSGQARQDAEVQLSQREFQVLRGLCDGQTNKDIAQELQLTEVTVKMYVRAVCTKLKANNRTQAAIIALSSGMI